MHETVDPHWQWARKASAAQIGAGRRWGEGWDTNSQNLPWGIDCFSQGECPKWVVLGLEGLTYVKNVKSWRNKEDYRELNPHLLHYSVQSCCLKLANW